MGHPQGVFRGPRTSNEPGCMIRFDGFRANSTPNVLLLVLVPVLDRQ